MFLSTFNQIFLIAIALPLMAVSLNALMAAKKAGTKITVRKNLAANLLPKHLR